MCRFQERWELFAGLSSGSTISGLKQRCGVKEHDHDEENMEILQNILNEELALNSTMYIVRCKLCHICTI